MTTRHGLEAWTPARPAAVETGADALRAALSWAVLAPSGHNTQPWMFDVGDGWVDVIADRSRALPVVDPVDRELTISVAAAATTLAVAVRGLGYEPHVAWWPDENDDDVVARVTAFAPAAASELDVQRFEAVTARCTNRGPFHDEPVPAGLLEKLALDAAAEGAHIEWVTGEDRHAVAELIARGDVMQMHDRTFRRELAAWTTPNRSLRKDGLRGYSFGLSDAQSSVGPLVVRTFDLGKGQAAKDAHLAEGSPALAVIDTAGDDRTDWTTAGAALVMVLLRLTVDGFAASFLNQPIEVEPLRDEVAARFGGSGVPQLLLRLGRPQRPVEHTPRLSVDEVLVRVSGHA